MDIAIAALPVDAVFSAVGAPATYRATEVAAAVPCLVMAMSPDEDFAVGNSRVNRRTMRLDVRASEVATPAKGGLFEFAGGTWRVLGDPARNDALRLIWTCAVDPED